ncbi:iron-sulfur cluster assembly scaffold protein [bacterium]|nr:iron-sulfur cluster assembly scaffold protein [bacterium]
MNKDLVISRYKNPKNFGVIKDSLVGESVNYSCGDEIKVSIKQTDGEVKECKFNGTGCSICIASTDLLLDSIKNKKTNEVLNLPNSYIFNLIGMESESARWRCATLGLEAVKSALHSVK